MPSVELDLCPGIKFMKKILLGSLLSCLLVVPAIHAQSYFYNWSYSSSLYSGSGSMSVNPNAPGNGDDGVDAYLPVTFTGTFNGQTIVGLDASPENAYQNFFYFQSANGSYVLTSPTETLWEIEALAIVTPVDEYIMYGYPAGAPLDAFQTYDLNGGGSGGTGDDGATTQTGTFYLTPVPEPSAGVIFGIGILAFGCLYFLRRKGIPAGGSADSH